MVTGEAIKSLRLSKNLEQQEFAESIDISRSWLNKIENNKIAVSDKVIANIERVYKVKLSEQKSTGSATNTVSAAGIVLKVNQDKLISRMCEFIAHNAASVQVIKADYISIKEKVTGRSSPVNAWYRFWSWCKNFTWFITLSPFINVGYNPSGCMPKDITFCIV